MLIIRQNYLINICSYLKVIARRGGVTPRPRAVATYSQLKQHIVK